MAALVLLGASAPNVQAAAPATARLQKSDRTPGLDRSVKLRPTDRNRVLSVGVSLGLRNQAALASFIAQVSDRKSPTYGHYLTPAQFAATYGPTQAQVQQVVDHLKANGLTVTSVSANRTLVDATGPVAAVESAFGASISDWHDQKENREFYGNDTEPVLPATLSSFVVGIAGLNNHYPRQRIGSAPRLPPGGGPGGGYTPTDLKTAYDVNPLAAAGYTGAGQSLGLFELDGFRQANISAYDSHYALSSPAPVVQAIDGGSGPLGNGEIEVELDIEVMHALSPASPITVWEGPNTDPGANDTYNAMVLSNTTKSNSTSWGICEPLTTSAEMTTLDNIFMQAAAQGQSFYAASGDNGAFDCGIYASSTTIAVDSPANDPYVTAAGGTNLALSAGSDYGSESSWSDRNTSPASGSGGGLSTVFARPSWQTGPGVANTSSNGMRQVPDVALNADPNTGYSVYVTTSGGTGWTVVGGTSAAAPGWAAFTALYNQFAAANGKPNLGFANPTLYGTASSTQPHPAFHDVTTGNNLSYPATAGWDYPTGWGSFDAYNFARDLAVSTDWPTYHRSNIRDGTDQATPAFGTIGQNWISPKLDGHVYGSPLVVGNHVIVATENNSIYSLDAATGNPTWAQPANFGAPVALTNPPFGCGNVNPMGITGTPAIDTATGIIYAVAFVQPANYELVAVNLSNGSRAFNPIPIAPSGFDPYHQQQRGALTLVNGYVHVPFGGYAGDCGNYHGWLIGVKADGTSTTLRVFQDQAQSVCSSAISPNEAAIWAPSGASADASGNIYAASGNGSSTTTYDCGETVFKLSPTLGYLDSWAPSVWASLNGSDSDIGSLGPTLVGPSNSLVFQSGKNGWGYLLNAGKLSANANHIGGEAFNAQVCNSATTQTAAADQVFGGVAYADPYIYVPCSDGIKALKLGSGTTPSFSVAWSSQAFHPAAPIISGGLLWAVDTSSSVLLAIDQTTGATKFVSGLLGGQTHFSTPAAGQGRVFVADGLADAIRAFGSGGATAPGAPTGVSATAGDGSATVSWTAPGSNGGSAIIGYRVTPYIGSTAQTPIPFNSTATSQTISPLTNGTTYTFTVAATNVIGTGPDSAASNAVTPLPAPVSAVSTRQYSLTGSDGSTWTDLDATNLTLSITPSFNAQAILSGNSDLWTANAGFNQDLGIDVNGTIQAWKESGGFAGTFSPNAAFVQTVMPMTAGTTYTIKLRWKTNKAAPGATIHAGAGPSAPFSPTSLTAQLRPSGVASAVSSQQYSLTASDGATWTDLDATNLTLSVTPSANSVAILSGNADLWTANAGFNQDLGIDVNGTIQAWKESGGFAGTFSPNAAFVQTVLPMTAGTTYIIKLRWKTNKAAPGATIRAGAGPSAPFSPTSLTAQLLPSGVSSAVSTQQYSLSNSDGTTWTDLDATSLSLSITPSVNSVAILSGNSDLWTANAGFNQDLGIDVNGTIQAWKESGGFAGTFSPNAAFVQTVMPMSAGTTYTIKLRWKTNKAAAGATIHAGAGPSAPFSPSSLTAQLVPA